MTTSMIVLLVALVTHTIEETFKGILPGVAVTVTALSTKTYQVEILGEVIVAEVERKGNYIEITYKYYELETSHLTLGALTSAILRHIEE